MQKRADFYSEGIKLAGLLHIPDDDVSSGRRPAIVLSHGYTGSKEGQVSRHAKPLVESGYVCLTFDHRGFGESEGPRGRLIAHQRVEDVRSAITYLEQQPEVDGERIGLFGLSFGGTVVLYAALDRRVKCVVSVSPFANGERRLRDLRRYWEWQDFLQRLAEDRATRVLTGQSQRVDCLDIVVPPPDMEVYYAERRQHAPSDEWNRPLESADSIIEFKPEKIIGNISPGAVLLLHGGADNLTPVDEARILYKTAKEPKNLVIFPQAGHSEMYRTPYFERVIATVKAFLEENLR